MERLNLRTAAGKAKIVGTLIGIGGAMVLTFVKGVHIEFGSFHLNLLHPPNGTHAHATTGAHTLLGSLCALASGISYALWLIIQVHFHFANKPFSCLLLIFFYVLHLYNHLRASPDSSVKLCLDDHLVMGGFESRKSLFIYVKIRLHSMSLFHTLVY